MVSYIILSIKILYNFAFIRVPFIFGFFFNNSIRYKYTIRERELNFQL